MHFTGSIEAGNPPVPRPGCGSKSKTDCSRPTTVKRPPTLCTYRPTPPSSNRVRAPHPHICIPNHGGSPLASHVAVRTAPFSGSTSRSVMPFERLYQSTAQPLHGSRTILQVLHRPSSCSTRRRKPTRRSTNAPPG